MNFHSTRLPFDSGGASTSWKIMKNDRIDNQLVHLIDQGIDTGPILQTANSVIPKEYQTPREIDEFSMEALSLSCADTIISTNCEELISFFQIF